MNTENFTMDLLQRLQRDSILATSACALALAVPSQAVAAPMPAAQTRPLVVAVAFDPVDGNANSQLRGLALAEPLSAALGVPVRVVSSRGLRDIASGIRSGAFDALWVPGNLAAAALKDPRMESLGTDGRTQRIALVASANVQGWADLLGRSLYLPLEDSPAGYVAAGLLSDNGIRMADFRSIHTGGHYEIAKLSVSQAITAVTALPEADAKALVAAHPNAVRLLETSPQIPGNGLVVRRDLGADLKLRMVKHFAGMTTSGSLQPITPATYKYLTGLAHYTPETWDGLEKVDATRVQSLARQGVALIDVRTRDEFNAKRIPGAQWLPYEERSARAVGVDYGGDVFDLSQLPATTRKLVFYCNGPECWKSFKASLRALGSRRFDSVYWFRGGLPEWERSDKPVAR